MARAPTPPPLLLLLTLLLTTFVTPQSLSDTVSPPQQTAFNPFDSPLSSSALAASDFDTPTIPPAQLRDASLRRPPRGGNRRTSRGDPVTGRVPVQEVRLNPQPWGLPYPNPQPDYMVLPKPEPWDMTPKDNPIERLVNEAVEQQERKMAADEAVSAGKPVPPAPGGPPHGRKGRDNVNINNNDNDIVIDLSSLDLGGLGSGKKSGAVVDDDEEDDGVCKDKYESACDEEKTSKKKKKNKKGDCETKVEDEEVDSCAAKKSGKKDAVKCEKAGRVRKPRKPYKPLLPPTISPAPRCDAHVRQEEGEVIVYKTVTVVE
ncbi:hypothetical protein EX30DRAFT_392654 [Ascodesmis nigricans]|uniref:Uncharacterized protein n=1 Tax=Ascodesmis nigricans TaxID=341454 RepID=A0A4S2N800_9PEZI|nr:hypothetical protein EX30DRAFT_392654 [Ascodesmis nigricans]